MAYVVNNAAFFVSHRLPIAVEARRRGSEVLLVTGQAGSEVLEARAVERLRSEGIAHRRVAFRSEGLNLWNEARGIWQVARALAAFEPDVVHCASTKGVLYGGLASRVARVPGVVLAITGMGSLFIGNAHGRMALLRRTYEVLAKAAYNHCHKRVIVQNGDDALAAERAGLASRAELVLIPGSGVDLEEYADLDADKRQPMVVLPARLLRDKGVLEFVDAARRLRSDGCSWRFVLAGTSDYRNPSAIPVADIEAWVAAGTVEWWGHVEAMPKVFEQASIACLPSYREGMPKALLEAAAAGCAIVTTDAVGCRDAIVPGETGDLVPVGDTAALAKALGSLIADPNRIKRYGAAGRRRALDHYGIGSVIERTLSLYQELRFCSRL